ncbi:hypothetical protein [Streptomyces sp. NPDC059893]|uniref:hypothetical protein n=1 Tax=Streptomyces sp. NPDC059893 TaxID=3346990 RepID=UPI00365DC374
MGEEAYLRNATRWHRLTENNLDTVRAVLGPRALLTVWPDLTPDVDAAFAALPEDESVDFVWEAPNGKIPHEAVDETDHQQLTILVAGARAACPLPWPSTNATRCSTLLCLTATACCAPGGDLFSVSRLRDR